VSKKYSEGYALPYLSGNSVASVSGRAPPPRFPKHFFILANSSIDAKQLALKLVDAFFASQSDIYVDTGLLASNFLAKYEHQPIVITSNTHFTETLLFNVTTCIPAFIIYIQNPNRPVGHALRTYILTTVPRVLRMKDIEFQFTIYTDKGVEQFFNKRHRITVNI
jgi:hypothetical protein